MPVTGKEWRGESDGTPRFGRKGRLWFARCVRDRINQIGGSYPDPYKITEDEVEPAVQGLVSEASAYVVWKDFEEYRGAEWGCGSWTINWDAVKRGLVHFLDESRAAEVAGRIGSLDEWLKADIENDWFLLGSRTDGGSLPRKLRTALRKSALERRRKWPSLCIDCGATFKRTPGTRGAAKRCQSCLDRRAVVNASSAPAEERSRAR